MKPYTLIFMGRPGSGKGTQAALLQEALKKKDAGQTIFYLETGARFRKFIKEEGYTQDLAREAYYAGLRLPAYLAVWTWASIFVEQLKGDEHLFIDGTPRSMPEALSLDSALAFYSRKPYVIYLDVDDETSKKRLAVRARPEDDAPEKVEKRLGWFKTDVMPIVEYYRTNPDCEFLNIDGSQPVEVVQKELLDRLGLEG